MPFAFGQKPIMFLTIARRILTLVNIRFLIVRVIFMCFWKKNLCIQTLIRYIKYHNIISWSFLFFKFQPIVICITTFNVPDYMVDTLKIYPAFGSCWTQPYLFLTGWYKHDGNGIPTKLANNTYYLFHLSGIILYLNHAHISTYVL